MLSDSVYILAIMFPYNVKKKGLHPDLKIKTSDKSKTSVTYIISTDV